MQTRSLELGSGAFDVLSQHFVAEGAAYVPGPQAAGRLIEGSEDVGVVRVFGQLRRGCGEPVGEAGDRLAGDREVFEVRLGFA